MSRPATAKPTSQFPLADQTELPEHEQGISARALSMLDAGLADAKRMLAAGLPFHDLGSFTAYEDDEDK